MKYKLWISLIFSLLAFAMPGFASIPPEVNGKLVPSIANMLSTIMPAVVNVTVLGESRGYMQAPSSSAPGNQPDDNNSGNNDNNDNGNDNGGAPPSTQPNKGGAIPYSRRFEEMGSGVIVDAAHGFVVTNAHVVVDAKIITITLSDGRRFKAKLIGADRPSDIAVLQIKADNLTGIPFGNSDTLKVGDFVAAIGNPFGLTQTVTSGVISALNRSALGIEGYENFIQTDASINPGNSGGALVNLQGQLIGVNTALIGPISGNVGISLAIPSNMVKEVTQQLIKYGKVEHGVLGVMVQELTPALADAFGLNGKKGALVASVVPASPADKAGIKPQDIIQRINDIDITEAAQVKNIVGLLPINAKTKITVLRKDKPLVLDATIVNPETVKRAIAPGMASFLDGVRLMSYDQYIPDFGAVKGVGVLDVAETSDAWISGLRPGDVILEANGEAVANVDQLLHAVKPDSDHLLLKIGRAQGMLFLVINKYS